MTHSISERLTSALADRYRIERELGQGGMATVFLANDIRHDRDVAIKVLHEDLGATLGPERFLAEIKTTAKLQHPHILPLLDSGDAGGLLFYVMPFVAGETLRERLTRDTQLSIDEAVRIAREVADALGAAHALGIIHRDIKPENILLQGGHALVADFGIALAVQHAGGARMTQTGLSLGTPQYMSPEQATGDKTVDHRSDIYALGAVTYEMLTGDPPFTGSSIQAIVAKVLSAEPERPTLTRKTIPPGVEAAVLTALEKLPADRFASAAQFAEALTRPDAARLTSQHPARATVGLHRPWLRDWRSWAALGVASVAVVVAAVLASRNEGARNTLVGVAFIQKSFEPQAIFNARFAPDGRTIVYSAALEGNTPHLYVSRPDYPAPAPLGPDSTHLLAISVKGELAVLIGAQYIAHQMFAGTLAQMSIGSGAPRELLTDVREADWSPDGSAMAIIHVVGGKDRLEYPVGHVLVESPGYFSNVRISPRGDVIALFEHPYRWDDRGAVIIVDRTGRRTMLSEGYDGLEGLAWSPDARAVFFSGSTNGAFRQVRRAELRGGAKLVLPGPGNLTIHDAASGGRWLVTSDDEQDHLFARVSGASAEEDLTWLDRSQSPLLSADGRLVVFTNAGVESGNNYSTMLRATDGSPAVRLGEGGAFDVSADGRWALSIIQDPPQLMLYPTGPGQARRLDGGEFQAFSAARFFSDGQRVLFCGNQPERASRCYVKPLGEGATRPVTPEGTGDGMVSPDGREVAAQLASGGYRVYPLDGGAPRTIPSLTADDQVIGWSNDGRSLRVRKSTEIPLRVEDLDLGTGRRSPLLVSAPAERVGLLSIPRVSVAKDSRIFAYSTRLYLSQMFTVEGMR